MNEGFLKIIHSYQPSKLFLLTSNQQRKKDSLNNLSRLLQREGYNLTDQNPEMIYSGGLNKTYQFRKVILTKYDCLGKDNFPSWRDNSYYGIVLSKSTLNLGRSPVKKDVIELYKSLIKVRTDIRLSREQEDAAKFFGRPSIIIGPAGSGKSVVITEKVANLVKQRNYDPNLKILLTSFNKGLIGKLGDWLEEMLDQNKFRRTPDRGAGDPSSRFYLLDSTEPNIRILNFDVLPTRLAILQGNLIFKKKCREILQEISYRYITNNNITESRILQYLNPEFLLEEFDRVFYGLNITDKTNYLETIRKGRGSRLGGNQKETIYEVIKEFMLYLNENGLDTIKTKRRKFLKLLNGSNTIEKFEYILVDEFQDCTDADYTIFNGLFKKEDYVNNLTMAGDLAQSIHIGRSADIPRDDHMKLRKTFYLNGSYRLPQRISEAIRPLSKEIIKRFENNDGAREIMPVKHSLPGARPILVYAQNNLELKDKLISIYNNYKIFDFDCITILEKDPELKILLETSGIKCETDTILRLKGLEKRCVLWSTSIPIEDANDACEFAYTILTRTSSILIITLSDEILEEYIEVIKHLDREKLICWDLSTKQYFHRLWEMNDEEVELPF